MIPSRGRSTGQSTKIRPSSEPNASAHHHSPASLEMPRGLDPTQPERPLPSPLAPNQARQKHSSHSPNPPNNPWLFTPPASVPQDRSTLSLPSHPNRDTPSMIGPTSSFYDPSESAQDNHALDYQQWIEMYGNHQQQQHPHQSQQQQQGMAYQQITPTASQSFSHQTIQTARMPNQYNVVAGQYTPPPSISQYSDSTGTATQSNVGVDVSAIPYQQQQQNELYYYSDLISDPIPSLSGQHHTQPHMQAFSQQQQPPPPQAHYSSSDAGSSFPPIAVSSPDSLSVPPSNPHSQSSLSPPSWTEDTPYSNTGSGTSASRSGGASHASGAAAGTAGKRTSKIASQSPPTPKVNKRKRVRKNEERERDRDSDSDSDDERFDANPGMGVGISVGMGGLGVGSPSGGMVTRLPGACTHCKKLKMKCDFPKNENTCNRCKSGGHVCIVEGRKPRTAPNKREYLLAQIRQKDAIIESLLKQLHNPYIATPLSISSYRMATSPSDQNNRNILAWLERLQSSVRTAGGKGGPRAFKLDSRTRADDDDDSDHQSDTVHNQAQAFGLSGGDDDVGTDGDQTAEDANKLQSSLPEPHVPLGLIANLSLSNNKSKASKKDHGKDDVAAEENLDDDNVGVANETYFMPGPATDLGIRASLIEQHSPPEILVHGLVTPTDVDKLFEIFYNRVDPFVSLLDPVLHTPASTFSRCPFLFTVICAISSRYYSEKSEIYPIAMHFAKHSAANALIDGWKSVELCQAYILMSIYAVPARRWEEDRSWLYTGLAIRIAMDLNLHQMTTTKPQNEKQEREILNRTRVWLICFNLDRSTATQFGKPSTIKEDYITRHANDWYKKSPYNHRFDVHLCAYSALLRIVTQFHDQIFSNPDSITGLNRRVDFRTVTLEHDAHLERYHEEWSNRFARDSDPNDPGSAFRCTLLPFLVGYSRLVMYSFGFQQAYQRGIEPGDHLFFSKCLDAAKSVIRNMVECLAPSGCMRYAPDGHFVFASFASAFLLKLLRPEFSNFLSKEQENEIFDLIGRLIQTLSSSDIAIDDRHTPKLYARFLAGLLSRHRRDGVSGGRLHSHPPPPHQIPPSSSTDHNSQTTSTSAFSISQPQGGGQVQDQQGGYTQNVFRQTPENTETPVYDTEATFPTEPMVFDNFNLGFGPTNGVSDEEMLATMLALKNPAWWQNMMMPGFACPDPQSPMMDNLSGPHQNLNIPGLHTSFGAFHAPEVSLH